MAADNKTTSVDAAHKSDNGDSKRGRSTIEFPYLDLDDSIEIATAVHKIGGSGCQWIQLAAQLKQAASGGGFRLRLISAKLYGLLTYDRGQVTLSTLGMRIADSHQQKQARVDAFLSVPLYKVLYEKFEGVSLPPTAGLEREIEQLGVAPKQKNKARQVFLRSAKQAGFFWSGPDHLVTPPSTSSQGKPEHVEPRREPSPKQLPGVGGFGGGGGGQFLNPFIQGLLEKLPQPETEWELEDRVKWLNTAASIFGLIYKVTDTEAGLIEVSLKKSSVGHA